MTDPNWWSEFIGIPKAAAIAAALGALLSPDLSTATTPRAKLIRIVGGIAGSIYFSPLVVEFLKIEQGREVWLSGLGFFLGLFIMSLIGVVNKAINDGSIWAAVRGRLGL